MIDSVFPAGTVIAGRFRLDAMVAEGGMGIVYRATEVRERSGELRDVRPVAIKLIHPRRAADETYLARFERETDTVVRLQHPNIVPVIDFGEWEGRPYIAFAWIGGEDLGARIARAGRLDLDETLRILAPVADALDAAHRSGLVHRDVKPGNILLGQGEEVYLTDFGLARPGDALAAPTVAGGRLMGTAPFIAPEQLRPKTIVPELAYRIDIYALACVAFACLTGDGPFRRDSDEAVIFAHADEEPPDITDARSDLPPALNGVLRRALAKNPAERPASARALVTELREATRAKEPVVVPPLPPVPPTPQEPEAPEAPGATRALPEMEPPPPPPARRRSWLPFGAAAGGAALLLAAVALATGGGGPGPTARPSATLVAEATVTPPTPTPASPTDPATDPPTAPPATPETTVPPMGSPERQAELVDIVASVASGCEARQLSGREVAAVVCDSAGPYVTDYAMYETWTEVERDWSEYLGNNELTPDSGTDGCTGAIEGEGWWYYNDESVPLGRIACHKSANYIWIITWTDNRNNTWGWLAWDDEVVYDDAWQAWKDAIIIE
jgi:serine/threonine-protein kinase